jgi:hypothetical protein
MSDDAMYNPLEQVVASVTDCPAEEGKRDPDGDNTEQARAAGLVAIPLTAGCTTGTRGSAATPGGGRTARLVDYADNDGPTSTVILTGAVGDAGKAQSIRPGGTVDPDHHSQLNLMLAQGSFRLDIADLDKKIVGAFGHFPMDPGTCSGSVTVTGAVPIVAGSGTGAYQGISGTFTLTVTIAEDFPAARCDVTAPPLAEAIVMSGAGTVSANRNAHVVKGRGWCPGFRDVRAGRDTCAHRREARDRVPRSGIVGDTPRRERARTHLSVAPRSAPLTIRSAA